MSRFSDLIANSHVSHPMGRATDKNLQTVAMMNTETFLHLPKDDFNATESLAIALLENPAFNQSVIVFKRLAIMYRKQKDYSSEVDAIKFFFDNYQPEYGGDMWRDVFVPRLSKAKKLLDKHPHVS